MDVQSYTLQIEFEVGVLTIIDSENGSIIYVCKSVLRD